MHSFEPRAETPPRVGISEYLESGAKRPSLLILESTRTQLEGTQRLSKRLWLADVHVDIAVATAQTDYHLSQAEKILNEAIVDADRMTRDYPALRPSIVPQLIGAYIRRAELPAWRTAASGARPLPNYGRMLETATQIAGVMNLNNDSQGRAQTAEFMPVLLGARSRMRRATRWVCRTSLSREDYTSANSHNGTTSWDIGFSEKSSGASYIDPPQKYDIKLKDTTVHRAKDPESRVKIMYASSLGFDRPDSIIWSCLKEYGVTSPPPEGVKIITPKGLDAVTTNISEFCFAQPMATPSS